MIQRENDGVRWELQPDFAPFLEAVLKSPGEIVKESPVKSVTRHEVGGKTYYVKRYLHHAVPLRSLKFFFKPTQARQEWELAQQLEERNIPIVRHVGLGERHTWRGIEESILVTEGFDGTTLTNASDINMRSVLDFVEAMHERGVFQTDLHPGNVLVRRDPFELRLVDLHGILLLRDLTSAQRKANLAGLRVFVPIPVPDDVVELSRQIRQKFFYERSFRWNRKNREFDLLKLGPLKWRARLLQINRAALDIMGSPDEFLDSRARIFKRGRTSTVGMADGLVLKRFNFRKYENLLKDLFRPSRAYRAFHAAYHLEILKIATARPIAAAEVRFCGFLRRSYFLAEEIKEAADGHTFLKSGRRLTPAVARQAAVLIARLHNEGFSHRDLKESNLIIGDDGRVHIIDLDGLSFLKQISSGRAAADLQRLEKGVQRHGPVSMQLRIQFLLAYCRARSLRRVPTMERRVLK